MLDRRNISILVKLFSAENQSRLLPVFFDSVFKSPYPFAFSLPVLCQEKYFILKNIYNSDQLFTQAVRASFCHRFSDLVRMLQFFHCVNFKSVAWHFQYLLKCFKIRSESNFKT